MTHTSFMHKHIESNKALNVSFFAPSKAESFVLGYQCAFLFLATSSRKLEWLAYSGNDESTSTHWTCPASSPACSGSSLTLVPAVTTKTCHCPAKPCYFCPQRDSVLSTTVKQVLKEEEDAIFQIINTWVIMEIDSNSLHPSIVSVSRIINIAFKDLKEKKKVFLFSS